MKALDATAVPLFGTHLIEASAGTGKTYAIATLYLRCLLESQLSVDQVLVVTYTRAATAELRERIRARIREAIAALKAGGSKDTTLNTIVAARLAQGSIDTDCKRLTLALRSFDQASISTIHGFCQRILQSRSFESGAAFDTEFETDAGLLINEIAEDFWAREVHDVSKAFFAYLQDTGFNLDSVHSLCKRVMGNSDLEVLPHKAPTAQASDTLLQSWQESFTKARTIWRRDRGQIIEVLSTDALNQGRYKRAAIATRFATDVDSLFHTAEACPIPDENRILKLTPDALAKGTKKKHQTPTHDFFEAAAAFVAANEEVQGVFAEQRMALYLKLVDYARSEAQKRKLAAATMSFDDLLLGLRTALRGKQGEALAETIRDQYRVALIDEFQDTDPVQYEVFRRIYIPKTSSNEGHGLFLIGDPKQAIYGFRGADLFTYFAARAQAAEGTHTLDTNWRSDPRSVQAVNALFGAANDPFLFEDLQFSPVQASPKATDRLTEGQAPGAALEILFLERKSCTGEDTTQYTTTGDAKTMSKTPARRLCQERVAQEILSLLIGDARIEGEAVQPSDIAVLVRQNSQARAMQAALRDCGIPSVLEGDASVFESTEAAEVERILAAMIEPGDRSAVKAALATSIFGYTGNDLHRLQDNEDEWDDILASFRSWNKSFFERGFIQAFSQLLRDREVGKRLLSVVGGQRKMTNINQLAELLQNHVVDSGAGPQILHAWLSNIRTDRASQLTLGDSAQMRLETDADAVKLVTVHKSKGLEYPIVFCPFAWDGKLQRGDDTTWVRFHDEDDDNKLKLDIGSEEQDLHGKQSAREALAEDLRLLYVAMTRARHRTVVVCGGITDFGRSGLAYLLMRLDDQETDSESLGDFAKLLAHEDDEGLLALLQDRIDAAKEAISLRPLQHQELPSYQPQEGQARTLQSRQAKHRIQRHWRSSSFTGLTSQASRHELSDHQPDHDADSDDSRTLVDQSDAPVVLADFPRGAHPGQMMHAVFEHLDFHQASQLSIDNQVKLSLSEFGFDVDRYQPTLSQSCAEVLRTDLGSGFCLADVPKSQRLDELEFSLPVRESRGLLNSAMLAACLEERSDPPWSSGYLETVRGLGFIPLSGFLKGFMDLVFVHEERWYLVDYKSNFLGQHSGNYQATHLADSMAEHHYFLQYHIYLVALNRYLRLRLPEYDYETHFGGVRYLYLRGMAPSTGAGRGVFSDRPTKAEMHSLNGLFDNTGDVSC